MPLTSERTLYDSWEGGPHLVWPSLGFKKNKNSSPALVERWNVHVVEQFNPFAAAACKISGLKGAHMHSCKWYIWWSCNKSTFSSVHFGASPFTRSCERGKFGTFISGFPSDGVANMAVKGLIITLIYVRTRVCLCVWERLVLHTRGCWHAYPANHLPALFGSQLCSRPCHFFTFLLFFLLFCPLLVRRGNVHVYLSML